MGNKSNNPKPQVIEKSMFSIPNMVRVTSKTSINDQYTLTQLIGKGTYGEVYKAKSKKTGQTRAIKKIDRKTHPSIEPYIFNELQILRQIDHPNILKMFKIYEDHFFFYVVVQLCPGKELIDVLNNRKYFNENDACGLFYQIVSGVRCLQLNKIMHRDLKPENIMVDEKLQHVKIIDFGSATRYENSKPESRRVVGTSYYIAPQVIAKNYNEKCDIWSLGVLLYVLLSGKPPFKGNTNQQIMKNVQKGVFEFQGQPWSKISESAKILIQKMLTKNPQKRLTIGEVMNDKWFQQKLSSSLLGDSLENVIKYLKNIRNYTGLNSDSIQEGMLIFIINFIMNNEDELQMTKCFKALDLNGDGVLGVQQLQEAMSTYLDISQKEAGIVAKKVIDKVDINRSGFIDYTEFVLAAVDLENVISEKNLDLAFDYVDHDNNGKLSVEEIRQKLGDNVNQETYCKLIKSFDKDNDGEISRAQFKEMMRNILTQINKEPPKKKK